MNAEWKVDEGREIKRSRLSARASRGIAALLSIGCLLGALFVSALIVGDASAAGRVVDVPCEVCGAASDPVQYSFMARLASSELGSGAVNAVPLTIVDASDPVQYTFAAARSARLAREAEIARLRGLAGPGAGTWARAKETVHLRGLLQAAASSEAVDLAREAEIARLRALAEPSAGSSVRADESVHLRGLLQAAASSKAADLAREAEIARLRWLSGPGAGSWARADESVHLRGLAESALSGSAGADCAPLISSTRSRTAEGARLTGLAMWYLEGQLTVVGAPSLDQARLADAARLTGLAGHLGTRPSRVSPGLACLAGP